MYLSTPKVLHTRRYAKHWAVHTSVSTTVSDCKVRWYSEKTHTDIVATNTSGHYPIQVPKLHKNEQINWRKPVSAANSRATMAGASSFSATSPKQKYYSKKIVRMLSLLIRHGKRNKYRQHKKDRRERCLYKICEVHRYSSNVISIGKYDRLSLRQKENILE